MTLFRFLFSLSLVSLLSCSLYAQEDGVEADASDTPEVKVEGEGQPAEPETDGKDDANDGDAEAADAESPEGEEADAAEGQTKGAGHTGNGEGHTDEAKGVDASEGDHEPHGHKADGTASHGHTTDGDSAAGHHEFVPFDEWLEQLGVSEDSLTSEQKHFAKEQHAHLNHPTDLPMNFQRDLALWSLITFR